MTRKPRKPARGPQPPTPAQAARIVEAAWQQDEEWGSFVWLSMVTGMRRAELLGLRWHHLHLERAVLEIRRNYLWINGQPVEKDTKTHRMRRIALDPDPVELLAAHRKRYEETVRSIAVEPRDDAFVFSQRAVHDRPYSPDWVTPSLREHVRQLGIDSHLHAMRRYAATELLTAGVDLRTVAGRLGHDGGGATTLRVYAARVDASDQQAAKILGGGIRRRTGSHKRERWMPQEIRSPSRPAPSAAPADLALPAAQRAPTKRRDSARSYAEPHHPATPASSQRNRRRRHLHKMPVAEGHPQPWPVPLRAGRLKLLYLAVRNLDEFRSPNVGTRSSG